MNRASISSEDKDKTRTALEFDCYRPVEMDARLLQYMHEVDQLLQHPLLHNVASGEP
jgi:hypothetical protein